MENIMELKTIRIYAKEVEKKDGGSFVKWSYTKDGQKFYEVRFTKECAVPQKRGYYLAVVDKKNVNIKKTKEEVSVNPDTGETTIFKPNDIMWIQALESIKADVEYEAELEAQRLADLDDIL